MDAKKCDRCGEFYVPTNEVRVFELYKSSLRSNIVLDLCPKCHKDLLTFMANPGMVSVCFKGRDEEESGIE